LARETAARYFGLLGICGAGGKILFGYLSDVWGRERINALAGVVTVMGIFSLMYLDILEGPIMPLLFAVLFGLGYGAAAPLFPSVSADIFLSASFGIIFAMMSIGGGMGGFLGSFLSGLLYDTTGNYKLALVICIVSIFISTMFIWLAGPRKVRRMVRMSKVTTE
jgi:MFS family permease